MSPHLDTDGNMALLHPPRAWLAVGQIRARENYCQAAGIPFTMPDVDFEPGVQEGNYGLTWTNGCWALWGLGFDKVTGEVNNMLLVNGRLPEDAVRAAVPAALLQTLVQKG